MALYLPRSSLLGHLDVGEGNRTDFSIHAYQDLVALGFPHEMFRQARLVAETCWRRIAVSLAEANDFVVPARAARGLRTPRGFLNP